MKGHQTKRIDASVSDDVYGYTIMRRQTCDKRFWAKIGENSTVQHDGGFGLPHRSQVRRETLYASHGLVWVCELAR